MFGLVNELWRKKNKRKEHRIVFLSSVTRSFSLGTGATVIEFDWRLAAAVTVLEVQGVELMVISALNLDVLF